MSLASFPTVCARKFEGGEGGSVGFCNIESLPHYAWPVHQDAPGGRAFEIRIPDSRPLVLGLRTRDTRNES